MEVDKYKLQLNVQIYTLNCKKNLRYDFNSATPYRNLNLHVISIDKA